MTELETGRGRWSTLLEILKALMTAVLMTSCRSWRPASTLIHHGRNPRPHPKEGLKVLNIATTVPGKACQSLKLMLHAMAVPTLARGMTILVMIATVDVGNPGENGHIQHIRRWSRSILQRWFHLSKPEYRSQGPARPCLSPLMIHQTLVRNTQLSQDTPEAGRITAQTHPRRPDGEVRGMAEMPA